MKDKCLICTEQSMHRCEVPVQMKKVKGLIIMLLISLSLFGMTACNGENGKSSTYEQITAEQAKTIMDTEKDYVIIDVRTVEEYEEGFIKDAICFPHEDVAEKAHVVLPDKEQLILVYCRSGRRSKIASEELVNLGYINVKEFGGIIDWPYDIVK